MKTFSTFLVAALVLVGATRLAWAEDNFGAIAISDSTGQWGLTYDYSSKASAEKEAVKQCGASDCAVEVWFKNSCGAVAKNGLEVAYGLGDSREEAEEAAIDALAGAGKIVAWSCTTR